MLGWSPAGFSILASRLPSFITKPIAVTRTRVFSSINAELAVPKPTPSTQSARLRRRQDEWTEAEVAMLRQANTDGKSLAECLDLLPSRTLIAIRDKRIRLGLRAGRRPKGEDSRRACELAANGLAPEQIKLELPHLSYRTIYDFLCRKGMACSSRMLKEGNASLEHWSAEEDGVLLEAMSTKQTVDTIAKQLAQRSILAIERRIQLLRIYGSALSSAKPKRHEPWPKEEEDLLTNLYIEGATFKSIALRLGRTYGSVKGRVQLLRREKKE